MVNITITPASWHGTGSLRAQGHAGTGPEGKDLLCAAVTSLVEGFAANLRWIPGIKNIRRVNSGMEELRWTKAYHCGDFGTQEANRAAWHFYKALEALAQAYPEHVKVRWNRQDYYKGRGRNNETKRRDHGSAGPSAK